MTSAFRSSVTLTLFVVVAGGVFAAAYAQAPLYYSNQNQYYLHGLAWAGVGELQHDWLANTRDPTPLFTALVGFTARFLHPWFFHLFYALLMGVYAVSLLGIFAAVVSADIARRRWLLFAALMLLVHSAIARWASYRLFGDDYPWFLQAGVAGQYILGAMFQPSTFGVLLVTAIALFLHGRPYSAVVLAALAATIHTTYLLPAGMITAGFMAASFGAGERRRPLALGGLALLLVAPVIVFVLLRFGPTTLNSFAAAQDILVNVRIPHHALPRLWLDPVAALQIAWLLLATALAPARLRVVLAIAIVLSVSLTLVQIFTASNALALMFPWRISAVLMPIATAVVLARLVALLPALSTNRVVTQAAATTLIVGLMSAGIWIMATRQGFHTIDEELPVMQFVRENLAPGDVYLLPVSVPPLARTTRGSLSSDFRPLPQKQTDKRIIPVNFQRFRLHAGAPIYVDFKAIPYRDREVIEWHHRLRFAEEATEHLAAADTTILPRLRAEGITHLVLPANITLGAEALSKIYDDDNYRIYQLAAE